MCEYISAVTRTEECPNSRRGNYAVIARDFEAKHNGGDRGKHEGDTHGHGKGHDQ